MAIVALIPAVSFAQETTETKAEAPENPITNFNNFYLSYLGPYSGFGHGYYGFGYQIFDNKGFAYSLSFHGSWGLVDDGQYMFRLGFGYGYAITNWLSLNGMVKGMIGGYTDYSYNSKKGKTEEKDKVGGGILFAPGIRLQGAKFVLGVSFDLGWAKFGGSGFYKDVELTLGYHF